jgi:hypothetical protein
VGGKSNVLHNGNVLRESEVSRKRGKASLIWRPEYTLHCYKQKITKPENATISIRYCFLTGYRDHEDLLLLPRKSVSLHQQSPTLL